MIVVRLPSTQRMAAIGDRVLDEPNGFELAEMRFDGGAILFRPPREL